jgi:hypothetical protein
LLLGNSLPTYSAENSTDPPEKELGDSCELQDECIAAISDSECFGNVCVCKPGYSNFDGLCKPGKFWLYGLHNEHNYKLGYLCLKIRRIKGNIS